MDYCIVLTTCPDDNAARDLASKLVKEKLAACVQLSPITSFYRWENTQHMDTEIRLTIKTRCSLYASIEGAIKKHHVYEVPQIIQIPVNGGSDEYLGWISDNTTS